MDLRILRAQLGRLFAQFFSQRFLFFVQTFEGCERHACLIADIDVGFIGTIEAEGPVKILRYGADVP